MRSIVSAREGQASSGHATNPGCPAQSASSTSKVRAEPFPRGGARTHDVVGIRQVHRPARKLLRIVDLETWARSVPLKSAVPRIRRRPRPTAAVSPTRAVPPHSVAAIVTRADLAKDLGVRADTVKRGLRLLDDAGVVARAPLIWSNGWSVCA